MAFLSKITFKIATVILGVLALMAALPLALLFTSSGRNLLADVAESVASGPDFQLEIGTLGGSSPGDLTIDRIAVGDGKGVWFEAVNIALDWRPMELLQGTIAVNRLAADRMIVARAPEPGAEETDDDGSTSIPAVDIGALDLARIDLGEPLLGTPASLSAKGNLHLTDAAKGIGGSLDIARLDAPGTIKGKFLYRPQDNHLTTTFEAREPSGGLIVRTIGLEGLPALTATVDGDGALTDWRAKIIARAGDLTLVDGAVHIRDVADSRQITFDVDAMLSPFAPDRAKALIAGNSHLAGSATITPGGRITIEDGRITGKALNATFQGTADGDGRVQSAQVTARIGRHQGAPLTFTLNDGKTVELATGSVSLTASPKDDALILAGSIKASGIATPDVNVQSVAMTFTAAADRALAKGLQALGGFKVSAEIRQPAFGDDGLDPVIGPLVRIDANGSVSGETIELANAVVDFAAGKISLSGAVDPELFDGRFGMQMPELAKLSGLAGRPMAGVLDVNGTAAATFATGDVTLSIDGTARELVTGIDAADKLIGRTLTLKGGVARAGRTVVFDALALDGRDLSASVDGSVGGPNTDLRAKGQIADLSKVSDALGGGINFDASIDGTREQADITAAFSGTSMSIQGKAFDDPVIRFNGAGPLGSPAGKLAIAGTFANRPINGRGDVTVSNAEAIAIDNLSLTYGKSDVHGRVSFSPADGPAVTLNVNAPDLTDFEDLSGVAVTGSINTDISLSQENGALVVRAKGGGKQIGYENITIAKIDIDGGVDGLSSSPVADGTVSATDITVDDLVIPQASLRAIADGKTTRGEVAARVRDFDLTAGANVDIDGDRVALTLDRATLSGRGIAGKLAKPTVVVIEGGQTRLDGVTLAFGDGRAVIDGLVADLLDVTVRLANLPLSLANAASPDLGAVGRVSGTVTVKGPADRPNGRYDLKISNASVGAVQDAGVAPVNANLAGTLKQGRLTLDGKLLGGDGIVLALSGSAPAGADIPIDLAAKGSIPLSLANPALGPRGGSVTGTLNTDLTVKGTPDAPQISGRFSTSNATLNDPESGIAITDIAARMAMTDTVFSIEQFSGKTAKGGTINIGGKVGLEKDSGNPANIKITARDFHIQDDRLMTGTLDADLNISGPMTRGPMLGGKVAIKRLDITVPDALPASIQSLNVEHQNASPAVVRQAEKLKKQASDEPSLPIKLNLRIEAANRIFVRGRGLDAALGGGVTVRGTAEEPAVDGAFKLSRGTLDILSRQMKFTRGNLEFTGATEPDLDFAADTSTSSAKVTVIVSGPASEPKFSFESVPDLPEDEILAQLIFDQSVSDLSPLQIARLGSEVARLGGLSGGPSLLGELQNALGIDVLDLSGGASGSNVTAGTYVNERVYLGVKQTGSDTGNAVIDLDITKQLKARGEFGNDGSSKIGIGVEFDY